jgi:hypothetical protein
MMIGLILPWTLQRGATMITDTGGPAFPQHWHPEMGWAPEQLDQGMTILDEFAKAAMQGELACQSEADGVYAESAGFDVLAIRCYKIAQAMLAEKRRLEASHE